MLPSARKKHNSTLRMAQKEGAKRARKQWQPWWQLLELVAADRRGQQIPRWKPGLEGREPPGSFFPHNAIFLDFL